MKKFAITAIVALSVAAPALAQTQLERSVGADAGQYTLSQLAILKAASTSDGNERMVYFGNGTTSFSGKDVHNDAARKILDGLAAESRGSNN